MACVSRLFGPHFHSTLTFTKQESKTQSTSHTNYVMRWQSVFFHLIEFLVILTGTPQYCHSKGVSHRDLKPANILLTRDSPPIVKVVDFGLANIVDGLTELRTLCGTEEYLAPEVVAQEGNEGYSEAVDSWSIGIIVFEMCVYEIIFMYAIYLF